MADVDAAKAKRDARRAERIAKIQGASSSAIRPSARSRTVFRDVTTGGNTPARQRTKSDDCTSPSPPKVRAIPRTAPAVVSRVRRAPNTPGPPPVAARSAVTAVKAHPVHLPGATPSASAADCFDALSSPEDDDSEPAPAVAAIRPPVSDELAALQQSPPPTITPPPMFQQAAAVVATPVRAAFAMVPGTPSIGAEMDALLSPDSSPEPSASAVTSTSPTRAAPPLPPNLELLRRETELSLGLGGDGGSGRGDGRKSTKRNSTEARLEADVEGAAVGQAANAPPPVAPPRRAKKARARSSAVTPAGKAPVVDRRSTHATTAAMVLDGDPDDDDAAPQLTVVLGRHGLKRTAKEEVVLQRQLCSKAAEIASLLAGAENRAMALESAKSSVIESVRLDGLERMSEADAREYDGAHDSDAEIRDVQLSGLTLRGGGTLPGTESFGFLVYRRGPQMHASSLFRLGPHEEVEVPTTVVFQGCEQNFKITVDLFAAAIPLASEPIEDELGSAKRGRKEKMKRAITKLRHEAIKQIKHGAVRLNRAQATPTRGMTPSSQAEALVSPIEFESVSSLTVVKGSIAQRHLATNFEVVDAELLGALEVEVAAFARSSPSDAPHARVAESGYLSFFTPSGPAAAGVGRWNRFYSRMDGTELQLWRGAQDPQWAVPAARQYRLAGFSTEIRQLSRGECARKHSIELEYDGVALRVSCESGADAERWTSTLTAAIAKAHAWDGAGPTRA